MSLAVLYSRTLAGMEAPEVVVEVHLANNLSCFTIVGLPEAEVKESKDRVRAALKEEELTASHAGEASASIREQMEQARNIQIEQRGKANFLLGSKEIDKYCAPDEAGMTLLKKAISRLGLSARAYHRILKVARSIADLASEPAIKPAHIAEAVQYRRFEI
jgi:predicted ATPase with chaperone activity